MTLLYVAWLKVLYLVCLYVFACVHHEQCYTSIGSTHSSGPLLEQSFIHFCYKLHSVPAVCVRIHAASVYPELDVECGYCKQRPHCRRYGKPLPLRPIKL